MMRRHKLSIAPDLRDRDADEVRTVRSRLAKERRPVEGDELARLLLLHVADLPGWHTAAQIAVGVSAQFLVAARTGDVSRMLTDWSRRDVLERRRYTAPSGNRRHVFRLRREQTEAA